MRLLAALVALFSAACTAAELPTIVEKPEVVVGENWVYAGYENEERFSINIEIEQLNDREIRTIITPNDNSAFAYRRVFDRQWNITEMVDHSSRVIKFSPYLPALRFPLHVDDTWKEAYEWQRSGPRESGDKQMWGGSRVEAKVLGWEEITVPAGTYTAIKVERASLRVAGGVFETYWYAPKIKRFIKYKKTVYENQKVAGSSGLDLVEYNKASSASIKGREQGPLQQYARADQEFLVAIERGNGEITLRLLNQGVDPNAKDALGRTALMYAGINGQTKLIMSALLENGANVNSQSLDGTTALIASVIFSDPDAVRLLLRHGADVNARDKEGRSALDWALLRLRTAPSNRSLLNLRERNKYGDLTMATAKEVNEVIETLKAAGAKE